MGKTPGRDVNGDLESMERVVDELRERTQSVISELERRIHRRADSLRGAVRQVKSALDVKKQVRAHPRTAVGLGAVLVIGAGLAIGFGVAHLRAQRRFVPRVRRKARALGMIVADPERHLHKREAIGRRVLAGVLTTLATFAARSLAQRLLERAERPALPTRSEIPIT
jgi:ElaB/YqjD/DUF883 family membrane-anchored ribosome-binding protein